LYKFNKVLYMVNHNNLAQIGRRIAFACGIATFLTILSCRAGVSFNAAFLVIFTVSRLAMGFTDDRVRGPVQQNGFATQLPPSLIAGTTGFSILMLRVVFVLDVPAYFASGVQSSSGCLETDAAAARLPHAQHRWQQRLRPSSTPGAATWNPLAALGWPGRATLGWHG
jgi:hypothetical protein